MDEPVLDLTKIRIPSLAPMQPDYNMIQQLEIMGYDTAIATRALIATSNSIFDAIEWIDKNKNNDFANEESTVKLSKKRVDTRSLPTVDPEITKKKLEQQESQRQKEIAEIKKKKKLQLQEKKRIQQMIEEEKQKRASKQQFTQTPSTKVEQKPVSSSTAEITSVCIQFENKSIPRRIQKFKKTETLQSVKNFISEFYKEPFELVVPYPFKVFEVDLSKITLEQENLVPSGVLMVRAPREHTHIEIEDPPPPPEPIIPTTNVTIIIFGCDKLNFTFPINEKLQSLYIKVAEETKRSISQFTLCQVPSNLPLDASKTFEEYKLYPECNVSIKRLANNNKLTNPAPAPQPLNTPPKEENVAPTTPPKEQKTIIQFRFPDGTLIKKEYKEDTILGAVKVSIAKEIKLLEKEFLLKFAYPAEKLQKKHYLQTLKEANLCPRGTLLVCYPSLNELYPPEDEFLPVDFDDYQPFTEAVTIPEESAEGLASIQVRLPRGGILKESFLGTEKLRSIQIAVAERLNTNEFYLFTKSNIGNRKFSEEELDSLTLIDATLTPRGLLFASFFQKEEEIAPITDDIENAPHTESKKEEIESAATEEKSEITQLQIRLSTGRCVRDEFGCRTTLAEIKEYLVGIESLVEYTFMISHPKREFTKEDLSLTLIEIGLHPRGVLIVFNPDPDDLKRNMYFPSAHLLTDEAPQPAPEVQQSPVPPVPAVVELKVEDQLVQLQIRLPSGLILHEKFVASTKLVTIHDYISSYLRIPSAEFILFRPFPRLEYNSDHFDSTLLELELFPRATLVVLLQSQRGVVRESTTPYYHSYYRHGRVEEESESEYEGDDMSYDDWRDLDEASRPKRSANGLSLPTIVFTKAEKTEDEEESDAPMCVICYQEFVEGDQLHVLPCKHNYHCECIIRWFEEKCQCPVCKYQIRRRKKN